MKVSVEDKRIREKDIPKNDRKIVSTANSMGILRVQVAKHIGLERMDSFLFQFGWEMGKADGIELMKTGQPLEQLVVDGPIKHMKSGHINGVDHRCDIEYNDRTETLVSNLDSSVFDVFYIKSWVFDDKSLQAGLYYIKMYVIG